MKKLLYTFIITSALGAGIFTAPAADQPPQKTAAPAKKNPGLPFRGKVSAVDKTAKTLALSGKEKARVFQLSDATKIKKDGKPATIDDVHVGESVGGYALRNDNGYPEVRTLNVGKGAKEGEEPDEKK